MESFPNKDLNLRLSPQKLRTHSNREQLIILMKKYHPWQEELNVFILKVEESTVKS